MGLTRCYKTIVFYIYNKQEADQNIYSQEDFDNYAKILVNISALKQNNNPAETVPKSSGGWK